ncbi:large ribosomal subunit protein mL102 (rPPR5) [Aristolochia californica]|uniref:large ribosomal subunit protein mL102 (rPPR5) n=1 Tax=Aristolochia californica TaxID=171875 RepID=UPI0035E27C8E
MAFISHSASRATPTLWKSRTYPWFSLFHSLDSPHGFCTTPSTDPPGAADQNPASGEEGHPVDQTTAPKFNAPLREGSIPPRLPRGKRRNHEKLEDIICRMMSQRAWTTRLQNSIRALVPQFDDSLVYNVLHGARTADQALNFFRWVERIGFRHDKNLHFKIIETLGRASKLNHARCILLDMPKKGVEWDEDLFVVMIESYGKAGIVQESVKMFQKMKELGVERTVKSYDTLFKVILRRGREQMARRYFNAMLREGVAPTRHTYNLLIWGFFLCLKSETAFRFYEDMKTRGFLPDVVTYNTVINGCCRIKKLDEAEKFFTEMKGRNLAPNVITYTTMIKGYVSASRVDDAVQLVDEMRAAGIKPNDHTFTTLLPGLCDSNKMAEARKILKEVVERHLPPRDNSIFLRLISCMCKSRDLDGGVAVLNAMIRLSIPTELSHYGLLIENFYKEGMYDRAVKLLDKVIEKGILSSPSSASQMEASAYNPMVEYLCQNGETKKAEVLYRQLMKTGVQDSVAFNNLVRGHCKEGAPELGTEILNIMQRRGVASDVESHEALVDSFLEKGEPADAKTALDGMMQNGYVPSPALFRSVMEALFKDERVQTASRVMNSMIEKGVMENMDLVSKILETLFLRGHVDEALGRINLLIHNGFTPDFDGLLTVLCEKDKRVAALKVLDYGLERDCSISFSSYERVLDTLLAAGKTLNAYSIMCKMMEKGGVTNWSSGEELIRNLNAEGHTKQADILSRMINGSGGKKGRKVVVTAN